MSRRTVGIVLAAIGVVGIAGSVVWEHVAEPKLVKYPTDVDESPAYEGTVKIFLDPKTYQPLDPPLEVPLHVVRHLKALGDESSDSKVVLSEKIDLTAEGQFTGELDSQYVMDRKTINNVADDRAWAFTPDNVVDRSPAFRLAFPFDTKAEPTLIYKNEIATTYMAQPAGEGEAGGLHVINFTGDQATPVPASPAYLNAISTFNPLPSELTLDQLKPVLKAKGLDVDTLLPQLLPNLTPEDTTTLVGLAAAPIKLQYLFTFSGADSVEPSTGSIVEVHDVIETLYVAPDPSVLPKLREVLARYPNVPAAVQGVTALDQLAAQPIMVFQNSFSQTEASVADVAKTVKDAKKLKDLATTTIPNVLRYGGIGLVVLGLLLALIPKRSSRRGTGRAAPAAEQPVEVKLAPGEQVVITDPAPADVPPADVAPGVAEPPGSPPPRSPGPP
jgi:hypothetical protein